jgi:nucleotide-binding universal stress UspA family protein
MAFRHLLVAMDFEAPSRRALEMALELALVFRASLTLLHVYEIPTLAYGPIAHEALLAARCESARAVLDEVLFEARRRLPEAHALLRSGVAWREILATIEDRGADLVVMGTHGRSGLSRALLGSVAEKIVRTSPVPVLTVHATDAPKAAP